jgi:hypothetical protein
MLMLNVDALHAVSVSLLMLISLMLGTNYVIRVRVRVGVTCRDNPRKKFRGEIILECSDWLGAD